MSFTPSGTQAANTQAANTQTAPTPERLFQMAFGFAPALILEAAIRHRLFDTLDEGAKTVEEISAVTTASTRGSRALMNALVGFNFLAKDDQERYSLTPESAAFLVSTRPGYQGGFLRQVVSHHLPQWMELAEVVYSGIPTRAVNQERVGAPFFAEFVEDLFPMTYFTAKTLADSLELGGAQSPIPILDLACGAGVWGIALAQQSSCVRVTAVDWAGVLPAARRMATRFGVVDQFEFLGGDLLEVPFGDGYAIATLGQVLHSLGAEHSQALLKKVYEALAPGGTIIIAEMLPNADRTGPPQALVFAVNMLINTDCGDAFTSEEINQWLTDAGFVEERMMAVPGPSPLILARKPA